MAAVRVLPPGRTVGMDSSIYDYSNNRYIHIIPAQPAKAARGHAPARRGPSSSPPGSSGHSPLVLYFRILIFLARVVEVPSAGPASRLPAYPRAGQPRDGQVVQVGGHAAP